MAIQVEMSHFWKDLMAFQDVKVQLSIAYHPQMDGKTEIVNKGLKTFVKCMCIDVPQDWSKWLALVEWWYNTTYHNTIKFSPYEVVYGQQLSLYLPYLLGESRI